MYTKNALSRTIPAIGTVVLACSMFGSSAGAKDAEFPVDFHVSARGLDLNLPGEAQELYGRLQHAAQIVCTHGMRVDLVPTADPKACYEQALAKAVRSVNAPLVTQVYLASHTIEQATARGIELPVRIASK